MIKGLMITPPVIGRISIGKVVEKNGKRLPEKDDEFTITTQIQVRGQWVLHPLDEALRNPRAPTTLGAPVEAPPLLKTVLRQRQFKALLLLCLRLATSAV